MVVVSIITLTECLLRLLPGPSHPTGEDPEAQGINGAPSDWTLLFTVFFTENLLVKNRVSRLLNLNLHLRPFFDDLSLIFDPEFFCDLHHNLKDNGAHMGEEHPARGSHAAGGPHLCLWKTQVTSQSEGDAEVCFWFCFWLVCVWI